MVLDSKAAVGGGCGGGGAVVVVDDDMGDGMQCTDHPFRSNSPGGICAFCLQDKLGKLVSSSSSSFYVGSSSSSSPSFRSDIPTIRVNSSSSLSLRPSTTAVAAASSTTTTSLNNTSNVDENSNRGHGSRYQEGYYTSTRRARIPFLLTQKKKKKTLMSGSASTTTTSSTSSEMVLKRSKSTATPRSGRYFPSDADDFSPRRRGFWSFLHLTNHKKPSDRSIKIGPGPVPNPNPDQSQRPSTVETKKVEYVIVDEGTDSSPNSSAGGSSSNNNNSNNTASFGRKVSRSRSVGCGSRSFSGDFFERISTGFGDCTLRRVESQREGKRASSASRASVADPLKERVRCGGLFGGFMMITSSSSSSSSSSYWTSVADDNGRPNGPAATPGAGHLVHGRSRSWGWAFASPMRAFQKPTTTIIKDGKRDLGSEKKGESNGKSTSTPNLAAIPSLLAVRG